MAISLVSTALSLVTPYLSKDLVDRALVGRDLAALQRIVLLFAVLGLASYVLNVVSGLRYTRVSAEILFDMRLALYEHLQRLSPRFYARTRMGDRQRSQLAFAALMGRSEPEAKRAPRLGWSKSGGQKAARVAAESGRAHRPYFN